MVSHKKQHYRLYFQQPSDQKLVSKNQCIDIRETQYFPNNSYPFGIPQRRLQSELNKKEGRKTLNNFYPYQGYIGIDLILQPAGSYWKVGGTTPVHVLPLFNATCWFHQFHLVAELLRQSGQVRRDSQQTRMTSMITNILVIVWLNVYELGFRNCRFVQNILIIFCYRGMKSRFMQWYEIESFKMGLLLILIIVIFIMGGMKQENGFTVVLYKFRCYFVVNIDRTEEKKFQWARYTHCQNKHNFMLQSNIKSCTIIQFLKISKKQSQVQTITKQIDISWFTINQNDLVRASFYYNKIGLVSLNELPLYQEFEIKKVEYFIGVIIQLNIIILYHMGKQPTTGNKKSKDSIAKAATQKKGGAKKWTKGKVKEKADNAVFVDRATYDKILTAIPKFGKHISVSGVIEKFKIVGSVARAILRKCVENGSLKVIEAHSKQQLYTPVVVAAEKAAVAEVKEAVTKKEKAPKKK